MKNNLKTIPVAVLAMMLFFSTSVSTAQEVEKINYISYASEAITSLYENKDLGAHKDLSSYVTPSLYDFLESKIETQQYSMELNNLYKTNYSVNTTLIEEKKLVDKVYLKFQVETFFNYIDLPNTITNRSDEVEVLIDRNSNKIIDIYDENNYFDSFIRGENFDIIKQNSDKEFMLQSSTIKAKQIRLRNNIYSTYEEENNRSAEILEEGFSDNSTLRASLNKSAIVNYARTNYSQTYPASGNGVITYYDFSQLEGNYDCTNFVSHALLAGGATVYDTGSSGISSTGWYYRGLANRSSSWSGVPKLHEFLTTNTVKGPYGVSNPYSTMPGTFSTGNILQFHNGSIWRHSTIITGSYDIDGRKGALVTGRTSPGVYNNNEKAGDKFPGSQKRVITLLGSY